MTAHTDQMSTTPAPAVGLGLSEVLGHAVAKETNMNKHTPGPWAVAGPTKYLNQTQIDPSIGCVYGAGAEVAANAALIAAAPEMLDALRKAVVLLAGACVHSPELEPQETYEAVSAAIAKATGATLAQD